MLYRRAIPQPPLSELVQCLWYSEGVSSNHSKERLLPNGECAVIFNLINSPIRIYEVQDLSRFRSYGVAVLSGARADCFAIDTHQQERVIGIQFRAGGAFPFLRVPASEAEGRSVDLDDIWPRNASEIRERLLAESTPEAMLTVLEHCLLEQLVSTPELHPAVAFAVAQFQRPTVNCSVRAVCEQIGISSRRFIELFHRQVGLTPKVFSRVRRFQHVLETVQQGKELDWAQVAIACGYYDQSHFIHEFQAFSGLTPSEYVSAATPHLNHVVLI
jgi:AraC-like DNA-binding protein